MDEWTERLMDTWVEAWMDEWMYRLDGQMSEWIDTHMYRRMYAWKKRGRQVYK